MLTAFPKINVKIIITCIVWTLVPLAGLGQSIWTTESPSETTIGTEILIPSFQNFDAASPSGTFYLYTYIPFSDRFALQVNLPFSRFDNGGGENETTIGNPYLGIVYTANNSNLNIDLGVRLPIVDEYKTSLTSGLTIEPYRTFAFIPESFTIISTIDYRYVLQSGLIFRVGGGPNLFVPNGPDAELYIKYYGQVLYNINQFTFGGGLAGLLSTVSNGATLAERTAHSLGIMGSYDFGTINSGIYLRLPIDDEINNLLDYVIGLNVSISL